MAEDNLGTKKDFGVNGKHTRLGEEFSMNEFKGYTLGTLKAIDERMERMDNYYSAVEKKLDGKIELCEEKFEKKMDGCEESIGNIEKWKSNLQGKIATLMVVFTVIGTAVMPVVNAVLQRLGGN